MNAPLILLHNKVACCGYHPAIPTCIARSAHSFSLSVLLLSAACAAQQCSSSSTGGFNLVHMDSSMDKSAPPPEQICSNDVYLTRHGARVDYEDAHWMTKAGHTRRDDPPLSTSGLTGAKELATKLKELHQKSPISHIVTSPFVRCVETAEIVAQALDLPVKVEPGICEVLNTFPPGFLDVPELKQLFPLVETSYKELVRREDLTPEYSDGQAARRARRAARILRDRLYGTIVFVGHGASCLGIAQEFGVNDYIGYTSLTHFSLDKKKKEWNVVGTFGDASHLSDKKSSLDSAY